MTSSTFPTPTDDRYFENYVVGSVYEFGPISVDLDEVISFATRFDPQSIHLDAEKSARGPFKGLITSGWHTVGLMMRLYVLNYVSAVASRASPGVDEVRWFIPVRPGDELHLRVSILGAKPSSSKPDRGTVISLLEGLNQKREVVCSMKAINLFAKRPVPAV